MSYTKPIYKSIITKVQEINENTLDNNDISTLLNALDCIMDISEELALIEPEMLHLWNEIVSDSISCVYSVTSGFYRQGLITLRSILELSCMSFYYLDHKVEYFHFKEYDAKANKYVSHLVNNENFYKTIYIKSFNRNIEKIQKKQDSVSDELKSLYGTLSDIVHGKYKTLIKREKLEICYQKQNFIKSNKLIEAVVGIIAVLFYLKYEHLSSDLIKQYVKHSGVLL